MGLLITFLLGIFILIGVLVIKITNNSEKVEQLSISIALGTMVFLVIFDLIPDVLECFNFSNNILFIVLFVILGIGILKILDIFIPEHDDEHSLNHDCTKENLIHIGIVSSIAIIIHNIIEGMAVYNMTLSNFKLGLLMSFGVGLHNIPMGMVIYSTIQNESKNKKFILILLVCLSTLFGGLIMMFISNLISDFVVGMLISITLGMLIYIIIFELIPHLLHSKNKLLSCFGFMIGVLIIFLSSLIE